ncbi:tetratricopeptide repeat protein [Puniceicoccales bacterium CK1056]|uniref:Tetratricopeptide repeat protein n=1 Tax=Oceanipulchritudo coccoides TaxID=2706888 RepID=A0A6B2M1L2_9BACT|nr:tetratricopeptide repeat protein [Oceanipulchritudo coccoides]NDV62099.1 tetratricopeptide repeat protein [Oceanipulchritudo coccoides]
MQLAWKQVWSLGFILFFFFSGCGERERPVEDLVMQAETLMDAGQIESAILILERCQERAPERVDVMEALAFAYAAEGDPMLASMTFASIAEIVPDRPEYYLYAAESLLEAGDSKGAVGQYNRYLTVQPLDRAVWVALADLQISQGAMNEALEALLAAEQVESRAVQRIKIGELYLRRNNLAQAQVWFGRSLESGSDVRDEALLGLLETAVRSKRFADAESLLKQLDAEYPGRLDQSEIDSVRDQLLVWRARQTAAQEAAAAFENSRLQTATEEAEALVEDPEEGEGDATSTPAIEVTTVETVPEGSSLTVSTEALSPEPTDPEIEAPVEAVEVSVSAISPETMSNDLLGLARAKRSVGETIEAIRYYKQCLIQNDAQPLVWAELSEVYLESGNDRWAQATASEAMRRDPDNPKLVLQYLRAAQRTMGTERLIQEMESAYRKFPDQPEIMVVLARAYAGEGVTRNARILYNKFLEQAPLTHPLRPVVEDELSALGR